MRDSSTVSWSSANATACTARGAWSGGKAISGTQTTGPLTANSMYLLACGNGSTSANASATVTVATLEPTVNLSASPTSVTSGGSSTLSWSSANVTSCSASGGWSGTKPLSGTASVAPLLQDATYSLSYSGTNGTVLAMAAVTVRAALVSWQAPTTYTDGSPITTLAGFRIRYGTASKVYTQAAVINDPSATQWRLLLGPGTWFFVVSAFDAAGHESANSGEVSRTIN